MEGDALEALRAQVYRIQTDLHEVDINVAVLAQNFQSLERSLKDLKDSVDELKEVIGEQAGALKLARFLLVICGVVASIAVATAAWFKSKVG